MGSRKEAHAHCHGHSLKQKMSTREALAYERVQEPVILSERTLAGHAKPSEVNLEDTFKCVHQGNSLENEYSLYISLNIQYTHGLESCMHGLQ